MIMKMAICAAIVGAGAATQAQTVDPRGVFFHEYSSSTFSGVEWVTIREQPGDRRYEFSDIRAIAPFAGEITTGGATTWDAGSVRGTGQFFDSDTAEFQLSFGGSSFISSLWRAPGTTPDFITEIVSAESGRAALGGEFLVTIEDIEPRTGNVVGTRQETMTLDVVGDTLRLTEGDGGYIQGVFESESAVGFRVAEPIAQVPAYRSFEGSETNRGMNIMADLRFGGLDTFEATVLLQTRTAPGAQDQFVERYSAVRVPAPGVPGACLLGIVLAGRRRR